MQLLKKYWLVIVVALFVYPACSMQAQTMYIGFNSGMVNSRIESPEVNNTFTSEGWGYNLGVFMRYGKRPFYQLGADWLRSNNQTTFTHKGNVVSGDVPLHSFDLSLKMGYEIIQRPVFKWRASAGPFIGKTNLRSSSVFDFNQNDFRGPQYGFIAGTGLQFTHLTFGIEYSYHMSQLFSDSHTIINPEARLETLAFKIGLQI